MNAAGTRWTLLEDEPYPLWNFIVPEGFCTDFASIPRFLWSVYPPIGNYSHATVAHDLCCYMNHLGKPLYDRRTTDWLFLQQMKLDGVGFRTRWTFWFCLRAFGWISWNRPVIKQAAP